MFRRIKAFLGISKPLTPLPCSRCGDPSFEGVCPSCFQRGEAIWQETTKD